MEKATKYLIFLSKRNTYFKGRDEGHQIIETQVLAKAKWYESFSGAESASYSLLEENPQIMTLEVNIEPIGLSEVITKSKWESTQNEKDNKRREKFISTLDKQRDEIIANWNREQGLSI